MKKKSVIKLLLTICIPVIFISMVYLVNCSNPQFIVSKENSWHTFKHDMHRSAKSEIALKPNTLDEAWVYRSPQQPKPAWPGPAKWDGYAAIPDLANMRNYDPVYHTTIAGKRLYYGSSTDDAVHCIDTETGKTLWRFFTGGPVRIAPSYWEGKLYFGSDDGYAYCIKADDGDLVWKYSPVKDEQKVINNGRFISFWPVRTGVVVDNGIAYFGASMLPWKESFLCALNATSGTVTDSATYVKKYDSLTLEGALLASSSRLIIPQGRISPIFFNRFDGTNLGVLEGGGGCFVLLTADNHVLHGPGNKTGWITDSKADDGSKFISYENGHAMVVSGDTAYILTKNSLSAYDRSAKKTLWTENKSNALSLIMAGDVLYCGGTDHITAMSALSGKELWTSGVQGKAYGLAVADSALFVSTDEGQIHCFRTNSLQTQPGSKSAELAAITPESQEPPILPQPLFNKENTFKPKTGPLLRFVNHESAVISWQTQKPSPTILEYGTSVPFTRIEDLSPKTEHKATVTGLRKSRFYHYTISVEYDGKQYKSDSYELDNFFNYTSADLKNHKNPFADGSDLKKAVRTANQILTNAGSTDGICLVLGFDNGSLAFELAKRSQMRIQVLEKDEKKVAKAREVLQQQAIYGSRISVMHVSTLNDLPLPDEFANLVVVEDYFEDSAYESSIAKIARMLKPGSGIAYLGDKSENKSRNEIDDWLNQVQISPDSKKEVKKESNVLWAKISRAPVEGAGVWSHQYGLADNSAFGGEKLLGATKAQDFEVLWMGRPGPRYQADRNGRKPSPLSINGRLFAQGLRRIVALDANNGSITWSSEISDLGRYNLPRDCSNWCADNDYIYTAIRDRCWKIEAGTGNVSHYFDVIPAKSRKWDFDWGYIASTKNNLIGSAVKANTQFDSYYGKADWYDAINGPKTFKVCSDNLFALDKKSGKELWYYSNGVIINSTISIGNGVIYFVESRNPKVKSSQERRTGLAELWNNQHLVAVNSENGEKLWEKPLDTKDGITVFYMAYGNGKLVIVSSLKDSYHIYAFNAENGKQEWYENFKWASDNHGGHMSRPAIVENKLYVRPAVFNLTTGERLSQEVPMGGCGTYACSQDAIFMRSDGKVFMWNTNTSKPSSWDRLRPDCWLSTIPAGGLLLSPEAGGGCSCGSWYETSIAFVPKSRPNLKNIHASK